MNDIITPEMRECADTVVEKMRAAWQAKDALTDAANRAFDRAFRAALRRGKADDATAEEVPCA